MGKGSNVQKAQAARERNAKNVGKTEEERKAAAAKAAKDAAAMICLKCRQTFMVNVQLAALMLHVTVKHDGQDPVGCFPQLANYDPNATEPAPAAAPVVKKVVKKVDTDLDSLLDAGLKKGKK